MRYADGTRAVVLVAKADIVIDGSETATMALCGGPGSLVLLGAATLETLGFGVDPIHKTLIAIEAPMASAKRAELAPVGRQRRDAQSERPPREGGQAVAPASCARRRARTS